MSKDEGNRNFPILQVLKDDSKRRLEELGWRIDINNTDEQTFVIFELSKERPSPWIHQGSLIFDLWITDCRYSDSKQGGHIDPGFVFGAAFGRFSVQSTNSVEVISVLPFFDFSYPPEEKPEKKETPPPPTMEISQADQDRSQQLQKEFKEIKAKYDRGEISEEEYQSATMSRSYEMMGIFGKGWDKLTEAMKQSGYIDPSMQMPDVSQAAEMMKQNRPIAGAPQFPGIPSAKGLGSEVPSDKIKCPSCGIVVEKKKFCSECGAALGTKE
jgi:hypothetical protein